MRIKEIEARLAAIKQEIEQRGDAMTAAEIDALEKETTQLTEERAGLIAAAEKRNGILDNIAKGAGVVIRTFQQTDNNRGATTPDNPSATPEYRSAWLKNIAVRSGISLLGDMSAEERAAFTATTANSAAVVPPATLNMIIDLVESMSPMLEDAEHSGMTSGFGVPRRKSIKAGDAKGVAEGTANDDEENEFDLADACSFTGSACNGHRASSDRQYPVADRRGFTACNRAGGRHYKRDPRSCCGASAVDNQLDRRFAFRNPADHSSGYRPYDGVNYRPSGDHHNDC